MHIYLDRRATCRLHNMLGSHISPDTQGMYYINPFPKREVLDASKPKESAGDNFKFEESGSNTSKWVENTAGKGEIAH